MLVWRASSHQLGVLARATIEKKKLKIVTQVNKCWKGEHDELFL